MAVGIETQTVMFLERLSGGVGCFGDQYSQTKTKELETKSEMN